MVMLIIYLEQESQSSSPLGETGAGIRDLRIVNVDAQSLSTPSQSILSGLWHVSHGVLGEVETKDSGLGCGRRDIEYDASQGGEAE